MNRWTIAFAACAFAAAAQAADWPQFEGPHRNGTTEATGLARSWPAGGPKVLWTVKVGRGFAGPAIADGKVYLLDRVPNEKDVLRCLDLNTGEEVWTLDIPAPGLAPARSYDGSRATPTVDGDCVYAVGEMGDFICVNRRSGKLLWRRNLLKEYGGRIPRYGVSQSPCIYKNLVLVNLQSPKPRMAAYDKKSGERVWLSPAFPGRAGHVSPVVYTLAGADQALTITGKPRKGSTNGQVVGLDPNTGKVLWTYEGWQCMLPIPFPLAIGGDRLFITGGYKAGSAIIRISLKDGEFTVTELCKTKDCDCQIHIPILYKGYLYANSNENSRQFSYGMICMSLEGKQMWKTGRKPFFERGNLLLAGGLIYNLDGATGMLHLIEPTPEKYHELARARIFAAPPPPAHQKGKRRRRGRPRMMWACMAFADGKLVLRSQSEMKCLDVSAP